MKVKDPKDHKNPYSGKLCEYSDFVFHEQEVSEKIQSWQAFFQARMGKKPLKMIYEIGCSNANFLLNIAAQNPDIAFIGIDWKFKVLYKGAEKIKKLGLNNIALIRGRASETLRYFKPAEIDEVWIFFPDPWAKKSQIKNRFFQEKELMPLSVALTNGGKLHFKTDHPGYYQWCMSLMGERIEIKAEDYLSQKKSADTSEVQSYRLKQAKVRVTEEVLPEPSLRLQKSYKLVSCTTNYWQESLKNPTLFAKELTLFEKGFVRDGLPIYMFSLEKE